MYGRRSFLVKAGIGVLAIPYLAKCRNFTRKTTHIVSISFDDGFEKSFLKTAEIYEKYKLSACFNVIASAHLTDFKPPDDYIQTKVIGHFDLWNELKRRGHEIMPHGYKHENLARIELADSQRLILKSLDYFSKNLDDFDPLKAIFNFPFNPTIAASVSFPICKPNNGLPSVSFSSLVTDFPLMSDTVSLKFVNYSKKTLKD